MLLLAKELKLVKVGVVSVDGSKFEASASKHRAVTYQRAGELIDQLRLEIADLMGRAEAADASGEDDPQALPKAIARREALRDQLDAARHRLEAQAKARAEAGAGGLRSQGGGAREAEGSGQGQAPEAAECDTGS